MTAGSGPEDVAFDTDGHVVTGVADGTILRLDPAAGTRTVLANTGGRPLGVEPAGDGGVLVCDHDRGLLHVHCDGAVEVLVDQVEGEKVRFASNVVQGPDGTMWFTTSSERWDLQHYLGDLYEHSSTGRLLQRDPDGRVATLLSDLKFANGLALAPDASHLLIAETSGYRIQRYWLTGPGAGTSDMLVENLPGFPDNMSLGSDGLLWVGMPAPRNSLLDRLLPLPGFLRLLLWNLPDVLTPKPARVAWVMAFDLDGELVYDLRSDDGPYAFVTSVAERSGTLVLGSAEQDDVVVAHKPTPPS